MNPTAPLQQVIQVPNINPPYKNKTSALTGISLGTGGGEGGGLDGALSDQHEVRDGEVGGLSE